MASYNLAIKKHNKLFYDAVDMIRLNSPWYKEDELSSILKHITKPKFIDINIKKRSKDKITDHDYKQLLKIVGENEVEWIGISNVENTAMYNEIRKLLGNNKTKICAKIETEIGCLNAEDIIAKYDGIMVDVEDLASEIGWKRASKEKERIYKACERAKKDYFRLGGVIFEYIKKNKIVYTYGAFDLLHPGHINMLKKAKELGDVLYVGIVSDKAIRELKGSDRPIQNQDDRFALVNELKFVDYTLHQDDYNPVPNMEKIMPDILVKGDDWDHIPGEEWIEEHGGKLVKPKYSSGWSTSATIKKIRETK